MDAEFSQLLTSARSVTLLLPQNPRLDWVAAAVSLASSLEKSGKSTSVICPTPMTVEFSRLVGIDKIRDQLGDKNLLIRFPGYDASRIFTVTYDTPNNQFELAVVTKEGAQPPSRDQIEVSYKGLSSDLVVGIAVTDRSQLGKLNSEEVFAVGKLAFLGNIATPSLFPQDQSFGQPGIPSICEIVVKFLSGHNLPLDQDIANNLLLGIESATNSFSSDTVTASTFEAAAVCLHQGATRQYRDLKNFRQSPGTWHQNRNRPPQTPSAPQPSQPSQPQFSSPPVTPTQPPVETHPQPSPTPSPEWLEPKIYTGRTVV